MVYSARLFACPRHTLPLKDLLANRRAKDTLFGLPLEGGASWLGKR